MAAPTPPEPGEPTALVLGAGGARGLAQIGVIEVLQARGFRIASIAGSSCGALVGGLFAAGRLEVYRDWLLGMSRGDILRLLDPGFGGPALFRGERLMQALRELTGEPRIEDLPIDFTAVAVDLMRQREVWLREGDLWDAIRASIAIPGVFTPHLLGGRELIDGGVLAPLPITATRLAGGHRLVAVDMHGGPPRQPLPLARAGVGAPPAEPGEAGAMPLQLLTRWIRRFGSREPEPVPGGGTRTLGFTELMARTLDTMRAQIARVQLALDPPELVIRIPRDTCQFYEFWRAAELIDIGREQATRALDAAGY